LLYLSNSFLKSFKHATKFGKLTLASLLGNLERHCLYTKLNSGSEIEYPFLIMNLNI